MKKSICQLHYGFRYLIYVLCVFIERSKSFDLTGKRLYFSACALSGVIPMSYFVRHIQDKKLILRHHGLGAKGVKAIAIVLVVYMIKALKSIFNYLER